MEPELAIVVAEVTKQIQKTVARTQQTAAKKKSAKKKPAKKKAAKKAAKKPKKKAAKKPKKKKKKKAKKVKKKKKKKKKAKKVRFVGGKRAKGQHKSKAAIAAGKKNALKQKAAGKGIFKVRTCSAALAAITGKAKMTSGQIVKAVWVYIKAKKLNNKRNITPDAALGKVIGGKTTMFKMNKALFKHVK
jgi:chromatin remodeling complex protein RSC6